MRSPIFCYDRLFKNYANIFVSTPRSAHLPPLSPVPPALSVTAPPPSASDAVAPSSRPSRPFVYAFGGSVSRTVSFMIYMYAYLPHKRDPVEGRSGRLSPVAAPKAPQHLFVSLASLTQER